MKREIPGLKERLADLAKVINVPSRFKTKITFLYRLGLSRGPPYRPMKSRMRATAGPR
jgi:hypothetical protein